MEVLESSPPARALRTAPARPFRRRAFGVRDDRRMHERGGIRPDERLEPLEVAAGTLRMDPGPKAALCAKHRIREYWVMDVAGARVLVHRDPARGRYRTRLEARPPERIAPLAFPDASVDLAEVFRGMTGAR